MNTKTKTPQKRGRREGSVSFLQVSLKELNRILRPEAQVILSLKYGMLVGLNGKPVGGDMTVFEYAVNSGKADAVLESFDNDGGDEPESPKDLKKEKVEEDGDDYVPPLQAELQSWDDDGGDDPF